MAPAIHPEARLTHVESSFPRIIPEMTFTSPAKKATVRGPTTRLSFDRPAGSSQIIAPDSTQLVTPRKIVPEGTHPTAHVTQPVTPGTSNSPNSRGAQQHLTYWHPYTCKLCSGNDHVDGSCTAPSNIRYAWSRIMNQKSNRIRRFNNKARSEWAESAAPGQDVKQPDPTSPIDNETIRFPCGLCGGGRKPLGECRENEDAKAAHKLLRNEQKGERKKAKAAAKARKRAQEAAEALEREKIQKRVEDKAARKRRQKDARKRRQKAGRKKRQETEAVLKEEVKAEKSGGERKRSVEDEAGEDEGGKAPSRKRGRKGKEGEKQNQGNKGDKGGQHK